MGAEAAGVDDSLGDPLVVEVKDLLPEVEVFEGGRTAGAYAERVLVVGDRDTLLSGQHRDLAARRLMRLAANTGGPATAVCGRLVLASIIAFGLRHGHVLT